MSRDRAPFLAQGTWRSGALHVWGWDGSGPASAAWLYSGFGSSRWSEPTSGWHDSPVSYGELSRLQLELPAGGTRSVSTVKLHPYGAAVWLSDTPKGDELSPSLAWFAELAGLAVGLVSTSRIAPVVVQEGPFTAARWRPVIEPRLQLDIDALAASAPSVCRNGSVASTNAILSSLVDGVARSLLAQQGWRPELGRKRAARVQALRAVFTALSSHDAVIRSGSDDFADAITDVERSLERHQRRLAGEPVVRHRLRLTIPEDAGDPWDIALELVSDTDSGRWCSADDVWARNVRAADVAGGEQHLGLLEAEIATLVEVVAPVIPGLADLATAHEPTGVELELELAEEFLDRAPHELHQLGIELIGPEHLVAAKVAVRGIATPAQADDRRKRFGLEALVEWNAVIDDTPIDPADLARAEAAGATLMHIGHRWVRIDPAGLRRARAMLDDHRRNHSKVGPLDLLKFASAQDEDAAFIGVVGEPTDDELSDESGAESGVGPVDTAWVRDLLAGLPDERLEEVTEPDGFVGELRHYQRRGLAWLQFLGRLGLGGCLADDMGLGKTATALAHLIALPGPHLVVCPLSVVHNWESEAARFTPALQVLVHHGAGRHRGEPALFGLADADIVVTTYGLLARDIEALEAIAWTTVVLDEAQMVKNASTRAAKAVRRLGAEQKLALTGTPVENRLSELWSILDAVNPGYLGSQTHFREHYATAIERRQDADVAQRLRTLTQPFVLRRTKADKRLLPDLPDKIEQIAYAQLTKEQATLYQRVVDDLLKAADAAEGMKRRGLVLAALTRLKQVCNHPAQALRDGSRLRGRSGKLNRFDELVAELLDVDERALVFTQFVEMGDLLVSHVREHFGFDAPFLAGKVSRGRRDSMVAEFQDGSGPPLLLVSLKAGGTGLNLTAASQVIHYDRWWNPAVEDQATDRAWRLGQRRTVNVHKLVCQGTVEERIGQIIDDKRLLADAVVGTGEAWLSELSTDDLRDLVVLSADRGGST